MPELYRTGGHWGVTIVREGVGPTDTQGRRTGDQLVAVVVNGDELLAERICALLNADQPLGAQLAPEYPYRCPKWLADAFGISVNTIRSWALRGQLAAHGHDEDGHPLYNAAEVRELDRQAKERKAEREARRQRRQENAA